MSVFRCALATVENNEKVTIKIHSTTPRNISHSVGLVVPENPEVIPENQEVVPENQEVVPENLEVIPENQEVVPENLAIAAPKRRLSISFGPKPLSCFNTNQIIIFIITLFREYFTPIPSGKT